MAICLGCNQDHNKKMYFMKLHIFRLNSIAPGGVGGPEAGALDLIYSLLLQKFDSHVYSHIFINQIGDDLDEGIFRNGKEIAINIKYPVENFDEKFVKEKNIIRLEIIHMALLRIAEKEKN